MLDPATCLFVAGMLNELHGTEYVVTCSTYIHFSAARSTLIIASKYLTQASSRRRYELHGHSAINSTAFG